MDLDIIDPSPTESALLFQHPLDGIAMLLQSQARDKDVFSKKTGLRAFAEMLSWD